MSASDEDLVRPVTQVSNSRPSAAISAPSMVSASAVESTDAPANVAAAQDVALSEAIERGELTVEGATARLVSEQIEAIGGPDYVVEGNDAIYSEIVSLLGDDPLLGDLLELG